MKQTYSYLKLFLQRASLLLVALLVSSVLMATKNEKKAAATEKEEAKTITGTASWYGPKFHGRKTATGDQYDMHGMTCASNRFPLGTWLRVTNIKTGKTIIVRVNDRMHPRMKRIIDLSKGAAKELGILTVGVAQVKVEDMGKTLPASLP